MKRKKNNNSADVNEKILIVAIDIGAGEHWGYFRSPNGDEVRPFSFCPTRSGFEGLWRRIRDYQCDHDLTDVVIGFESTGSYAEPFIHFFREKGVRLVQVNPMHTKRLKELTGNTPHKTDQKDPRVIADIIGLGHGLSVIVPQGVSADLRRLIHARERAVSDLTAKNNQLTALVFVVFPEFLTIMKTLTSRSALFLLKRYPLPEAMKRVRCATLVRQLRRISRGRLGTERAYALLGAARRSVGIIHGASGIAIEITYLIDQIEQTQAFIGELEQRIQACLRQIPWSRNLLSLPGVGAITVGGLIGEIGDFKAFHTVKELEKLAGLTLYEISSGAHKGRRRISKRGRPLIRKLLYLAALNTVKTDGIMYHRYHRMLDHGMPSIKALVAISRTLLGIMYALVRDNTVFERIRYEENVVKNVA